jgi:hypothetical protein
VIVGTGTLSRDDVVEVLGRDVWRSSKNLTSMPHSGTFWIAFDEGFYFPERKSPLRSVNFTGLIIVMADEDEDGFDRGRPLSRIAPTQEIADAVVRHLLDIEEAAGRYIVPVHCMQGAYRSGAVVQWLVSDFGIQEDKTSRRLLNSPTSLTYNKAFLRMLKTAADRLANPVMADRIRRHRALSGLAEEHQLM